ncbi:MAG: hypothetical protein U0L10_10410, partial [Lachnospiraceae bacterium]|nr:hypothetical protein [Lachnospiraceae bacterium]
IYVDTLFDHQRNNFLLYSDDETQFADYDNDGVKDHKDPYPKDPGKSYLDFTVLPIADQKYTGEELKPELVVTDEEGILLKPEEDYEIQFTDNIRPGTAIAVVTGKRFHTVSKEVTFNIICDHAWGKWGLVKTPTIEKAGSRQRTCSLCGETETQDIPALEAILDLPAGLTRIESEAFSRLVSVDAVRIPETVTEIAEDAFTDSDIIIIAPEGSYAAEWAENHNVTCIID